MVFLILIYLEGCYIIPIIFNYHTWKDFIRVMSFMQIVIIMLEVNIFIFI